MKLGVWFVVAALAIVAGGACGGGSVKEPPVDSAPVEMPPTGFTFEAVGDRSFASFGWTGTIHNLRVPDGTPFGVTVTSCDGLDGICAFEGPTDPVSKVNRRRCLNQMSTTCTMDSECPADPASARKCVYIYDPPAGTPIKGLPDRVGACGWSYIVVAPPGAPKTITGTLDQTSGELNLNLSLFLALNGAPDTYRGACAECVGDIKPNDGVKDGTCTTTATSDQTPDQGKKCDVHRFGSIPSFEGSYSMDCAPTVTALDQPASRFGGTFTSSGYQISINPSSPDCSDPRFLGQKCFCGMCPAKTGVPPHSCFSNADCGGDTCGELPASCMPNGAPFDDSFMPNGPTVFDNSKFPNQCRTVGMEDKAATAPNSCAHGECNWNAEDGTGTCRSTLTGQMVGCYPSGMGATIKAPGGSTKSGSVWIVDTATAGCAPYLGAQNNSSLGLPGLTFQKRSFRIIAEHTK